MKADDTYIIADDPASLTVQGHGGEAVTIIGTHGRYVEIQLPNMGNVGRRLVIREDLVRGGQLELL